MALRMEKQPSAEVYTAQLGENNGMVVLYDNRANDFEEFRWCAEVFVNGGSVACYQEATKVDALIAAREALVSELQARRS